MIHLILLVFSLVFLPTAYASIHHIESILELPTPTKSSLYLFDIDDTLIDSSTQLGSKSWRKYIRGAVDEEKSTLLHDKISLYLAYSYPIKTLEDLTASYIKNLQALEIPVLAFTARERKSWYDQPNVDTDRLTSSQLKKVGLDLKKSEPLLDDELFYLIQEKEYFEGIYFSNFENKGEYLASIFKNARAYPLKIVFIDDKKSQIDSVARTLDDLGIENECYWYTASDQKALSFNPLLTNIQLAYFVEKGQVLTDLESSVIADSFPERTDLDWLRIILENELFSTEQ